MAKQAKLIRDLTPGTYDQVINLTREVMLTGKVKVSKKKGITHELLDAAVKLDFIMKSGVRPGFWVSRPAGRTALVERIAKDTAAIDNYFRN